MKSPQNGPRILVLDNYDSFTFNLVQYLGEFGAQIQVLRNDEITAAQLKQRPPDGLLVSPGPGTPEKAGVSVAAIRALDAKCPILGVCLGHQALAYAFGGTVDRAAQILHGKTSEILHGGRGIFEGLSNPFPATRYHSLEVPRRDLPEILQVVAWTTDDEVMGIRKRGTESWGVQFHPESILSQGGKKLVQNWLALCAT